MFNEKSLLRMFNQLFSYKFLSLKYSNLNKSDSIKDLNTVTVGV